MLTSSKQSKNNNIQDISMIRQKLQQIIQTLQHEKSIFQANYNNKIKQYQSQIRQKNSIIQELNNQLTEKYQQIEELRKKEQFYKGEVGRMKEEFFKIVAVVQKVNILSVVNGLKRNESDPFEKIQVKKMQKVKSTQKFDINQYFQQVKMKQKTTQTFMKPFSEYSPTYNQTNIQVKCLEDLTNTKTKQNMMVKTASKIKPPMQTYRLCNLPAKNIKIRSYKQNIWDQTL